MVWINWFNQPTSVTLEKSIVFHSEMRIAIYYMPT